MAGGGVIGKGDGIARGIIVQDGSTIETLHLFIMEYHQVGGAPIDSIVIKEMNGTPREYLSNNFNRTGAPGKRTDIGRSKILGASRV